MGMNMRCISHGTSGPRDATKNYPLFTAAWQTQVRNSGPIMDGSAQIGLPKMEMTPAKKAHKRGIVRVRGNSAFVKSAKRCGITVGFWRSQAFHVTASQAQVRATL